MRKQLQAEQGKSDLEEKIQQLEQRKQKLEEKVRSGGTLAHRPAEQEGLAGEEDKGAERD